MAKDDGKPASLAARAVEPATLPPADLNAHLAKTGLDLFPLIVFFVSNLLFGIFWATALCMAATAISLLISWLLFKRVSTMALVTGAGVLIFGSLTIWLHNDLFVKIKPTIINLLFAGALLGGLLFNQLFVRVLLGEAIRLTEQGWRKLQLRWGLFFILLALINEAARHYLSTEAWAASKFASFPLTFVFMLMQLGLFKQFSTDPVAEDAKTPQSADHLR